MAQTVCIILDATQRARLNAIVGDQSLPLKHIQRARIVLLSHATSPAEVRLMVDSSLMRQFLTGGLGGLGAYTYGHGPQGAEDLPDYENPYAVHSSPNKPADEQETVKKGVQSAPGAAAQTPPCPGCDDEDPKKRDPNKGKQTPLNRSNLENKLKDYALNPDHPSNGGKAAYFKEALGFDQSNWKNLANQVEFDQNTAAFDRVDERGIAYYNQDLIVQGPNGNARPLDATFAVEKGEARLITVVPAH